MPGNAAVNTEQEPFLGCSRALPLQAALHGYNLRRVGVGQDAKADVLGAVPFVGSKYSMWMHGDWLPHSVPCLPGSPRDSSSPTSRKPHLGSKLARTTAGNFLCLSCHQIPPAGSLCYTGKRILTWSRFGHWWISQWRVLSSPLQRTASRFCHAQWPSPEHKSLLLP